MGKYFLIHINNQNQIDRTYAVHSIILIFFIMLLFIFLSARKKDTDKNFLALETSNTFKGIALILLLFGHFAAMCIEGTLFFEIAGRWAVIIFLYLSGIGLCKTYGMSNIDNVFLTNRLKRLAFPTLITLTLFYFLDYFFVCNSYSLKNIILNYMGILTPDPPNGPAWFITYIIFLYLSYFLVSKVNSIDLLKVATMLVFTCLVSITIWNLEILKSEFKIWIQYTLVFPITVLIGVYRKPVEFILEKLYKKSVFYFFVTLTFSILFLYIEIENSDLKFTDNPLTVQVIYSFDTIIILIALTMFCFLIDRMRHGFGMIEWFGKNSFEIYLVHFPFMVYYDFFLFRKPLFLFFYLYLAIITILGISVRRISDILLKATSGLYQILAGSTSFKRLLTK